MSDAEIKELLLHKHWLRSLAVGLVRDRAAAEDLVQETWVAALRRPPARDRPVGPWLRTVLTNMARNRQARAASRAARERAWQRDETVPSAESLLVEHETMRLVAELVSALDEPYRSTILLCYDEGLSPSTIATRQGIPAGTVRWRLKRGLDELRAKLDERHGGDRRAWVAALVPIARQPRPVRAAGRGMITRFAVMVPALAALVIVGGAHVRGRSRPPFGAAPGHGPAALPGPFTVASAAAPPIATPAADPVGARGHRIRGRVVERAGGPIPRAEVSFWRFATSESVKAVADDEGRFQIRVWDGHVYAEAAANGYASSRQDLVVIEDQTLELRLAPLGGLTGYARTAAGAPVPQAQVSVIGDDHPPVHAEDDGAFGFARLGPGQRRVLARGGGLAGLSAPVEIPAGSVASAVTVTLAPGRTLRGRVLDEHARPLAGVKLALALEDKKWKAPPATTDADGRFRFDELLPHGHVLTITASGRGSLEYVPVELDRGDVDRVYHLPAGARLTGVVLDRDGAPAPDVAIQVWRMHQTRSGPDGRFTLEDLESGNLTLTAAALGRGFAQRKDLTFVAGQTLTVVVRLGPGGDVSGTVRYRDGRPAAGATVFALTSGGPALARAGADGRYRMTDLPQEPLSLQAMPAGDPVLEADNRQVARREVHPSARKPLANVDLVVDSGPRALRGLVRDPAGRPLGDVKVKLTAEAIDRRAHTDAEGRFVVEGLPGGVAFKVEATDARFPPARATAGPKDDLVTLAFVAPASIEGVVVDDQGVTGAAKVVAVLGPPAAGDASAHETSLRRHTSQGEARAGADGRFLLRPLAPGTYELLAKAATSRRHGRALVTVKAGEATTRVRLVLDDDVIVSGRLVEVGTGAALAGVVVSGWQGEETTTGGDGRFTLPVRQAPARYLIATDPTGRHHKRCLPVIAPPGARTFRVGDVALVPGHQHRAVFGVSWIMAREGFRLEVDPNGRGAALGLESGDLITAVNQHQFGEGMESVLCERAAGSTLRLTVARPGAGTHEVVLPLLKDP